MTVAFILRRLLGILALSAASAVAVSILSSTRRGAAAPLSDPSAEPLPLPLPAPTVASFQVVRAGGSVLLRVHTDAPSREAAVLVIDHGTDIEILTALPATATGGAIGFVCDAALLESDPAFYLQIGEKTVTLAAPVELVLAA